MCIYRTEAMKATWVDAYKVVRKSGSEYYSVFAETIVKNGEAKKCRMEDIPRCNYSGDLIGRWSAYKHLSDATRMNGGENIIIKVRIYKDLIKGLDSYNHPIIAGRNIKILKEVEA